MHGRRLLAPRRGRRGRSGDTVRIRPGCYPLTATEAGGGPGDGSIEIGRDLRVVGTGETGAFLDASALGAPLFRVRGGARVEMRHLTLFGAETATGAPVAWVTDASVRFVGTTLAGGRGDVAGAVLAGSDGHVRFTDSLLLDNRSSSGAGAVRATRPGALVSARGSAFVGNQGERGGADRGRGRRLVDVTLARNAADRGGALLLTGGAELRNAPWRRTARERAPPSPWRRARRRSGTASWQGTSPNEGRRASGTSARGDGTSPTNGAATCAEPTAGWTTRCSGA